jgi:hypothetical protein
MITTILYTLVFVLAFPSLADAECAWVLWEWFPRDQQYGSRPEAFTTAKECSQAIIRSHKVLSDQGDTKNEIRAVAVMATPYEGTISVSFKKRGAPDSELRPLI